MKRSSRTISLSIATIIGIAIGVAIATAFPMANAASQSGFVITGTLSLPGVPAASGAINRIEDKEAGVICYQFAQGGLVSCVKK